MTEICRSLCCPTNSIHRPGQCGPPPPTPDPVTQAEAAAFGPRLNLDTPEPE